VHLETHDSYHELKIFHSTMMDSKRSWNVPRCSYCQKRGYNVEICWKKHSYLRNKHQENTKANSDKVSTFKYEAKGLINSKQR
jgi:hypothetical protein